MGQYDRRTNQIVTGQGSGAQINYNIWPTPTGVPAAGIAVLSGAGGWGLTIDIAAAAWNALEFWVCGFFQTTLNAAIQVIEQQFSSTGPAAGNAGPLTAPFIYACRWDPSLVSLNLALFSIPIPVYRPAGARVAGCSGGAAARSTLVSMLYATGL